MKTTPESKERARFYEKLQWLADKGKEKIEKEGLGVFVSCFIVYSDGSWQVKCDLLNGGIVVPYQGNGLGDVQTAIFKINKYGVSINLAE